MTGRNTTIDSMLEDGNDHLNTSDLDMRKKKKMEIDNVVGCLEFTQKLMKVSVHGRSDKWVWNADSEDIINVGKEMESTQSDINESYFLNPMWSSPLVKCVDSSPLVIVRNYYTNTPPLSSMGGKEVLEAGMLFIGSHGGDFTAVDYKSGHPVWTLDLNSKWKGSGTVHIEGSASCDMRGDVVYIGCFRGDDVDGLIAKEEEEEVQEQEEQQQSTEDREDGDRPISLGRVFAVQASTGHILWATPIGGEIKGTIAGSRFSNSVF